MRVFIDANVIMDVLLKRPDFMQDSMDVIQMGIDKDIELFASPLTFATCHYLLRKEIPKNVIPVLTPSQFLARYTK